MNKPMGNRVRTMTQLALLLALLLILSYTPLGYLPVGPLVLSLLSVPVAIGAMLLGPLGGAVLGGAFGLTSFFNMMRGSSPMGAALFAISPAATFVLCFVSRVAMGVCCALVYRLACKLLPRRTKLRCAVGALAAPRGHRRTLALSEKLDALCRGVRALVKLAGQLLHGKHAVARGRLVGLLIDIVHIRLRENSVTRLREFLRAHPGNIVAVEQLHVRDGLHAEILHQIRPDVLGLHIEARFLLHKYANYVRHNFPRFRPCGQFAARAQKSPRISLFLLLILSYCLLFIKSYF